MRWERVQRQVGLSDSSSGPGKRWGHTCNTVKGGRFVYVFGGFGKDGYFTNQVHVFDAGRQIWSEPMIRGVPPSPRDSHSCTTVGDNLFVFGGTDGKHYLNDLHVLDTSSHTWKCLEVRGEEPDAREAHSATLVGKHIFVFGGCGKVPGLDDEVFFNDLYILNTETITWQRAVTTGTRPFARDGHTCSTWNNKIIVVGGEHFEGDYLSDVHILDTDTFAWKQLKTSWQPLTPRAGHITVAIESNLFVFGGFRDPQNLYNDLYVLDVETGVWSKIVAMEDRPPARFSAAAVCLGPYKAGSFFFFGGCNKNLEPLDDIYYFHTDGVYEARSAQKEALKCKEQQKEAVEQGKTVFQARVTENSPLGYYSIETTIDGKVLRGVLLSSRHPSSVQTADPSSTSRKRPAMLDADCDHGAKTQRTLSKDTSGSSQQAGPVDPSDDAYKKDAEPSLPVTLDQANVEPLRNEMSTDVGAGGDSSPQKQDEERVAAEDAEPK
ncbi:PREDICTED: tip elongation aberrant protein 1 [Brassica oleracea var. oleracea]|uniref:tip elongation aberrant protein 1 n=1 Tax=Brassica oleracea var. oleracea TaxID=109376 RepID=UPI0006A7245A|nr:PREDICTED: tip elongation aberrant protein 1 [Brassica oleracea var. oleracea]